ncbi:MAG: hypothetical protein Q8N16_02980 [bacterium]|nr:hypothetical protein [bacterium]
MPQYISLQEATKYCHYSQEYLSLRARRGKIKAIKVGRNWVTTKDWVQEYVRQTQSYSEYVQGINAGEISVQPKEQKLAELKLPSQFPSVLAKSAFILGLVSVFIIIGGIAASKVDFKEAFSETLANVSQNLSAPALKNSAKNVGADIGEYGNWLEDGVFGPVRKIAFAYSRANDYVEEKLIFLGEKAISVTKVFVRSFKQLSFAEEDLGFEWRLPKIRLPKIELPKIDTSIITRIRLPEVRFALPKRYTLLNAALEQEITDIGYGVSFFYSKFSDFLADKIVNTAFLFLGIEKPAISNSRLLIIPYSEDEGRALEEKIKSGFSDEIEVKMKDDGWGIIKPVFKSGKQEEYFYMVIPGK